MTYRGPASAISSADPSSGQGVDRGVGERILAVLAASDVPLSTNEVAKRARIWTYQASSVLCRLRKCGKVAVAGRIKGDGYGISRRKMNTWRVA